MSISLKQLLALVGKLDDSPGEETARERFRRFLLENVTEVGQLRDYVEECVRSSGDQYNRALQDLVNHLGRFLEFEVTFGRYKGVPGAVGFDGLWKSSTGFNAVVEVKTSEAYAIKCADLVGYVDELISEGTVPNWDNALGLYVVGRPDPEVRQLENSIVAEKRTDQLRVISVDALISLAEVLHEYDVTHNDILETLRPSGPMIDPIVDLMTRLASQAEELPVVPPVAPGEVEAEVAYWLTPVREEEEQAALEVIDTLVGKERIYAFGERTPGRKHLKPGDWICFYGSGTGVVAHARVATLPERKPSPKVRHPERYPWTFGLDRTQLYLDDPVVIDSALRTRLDTFKDRDPNKRWAWFVQATRSVNQHDFEILTRQ